MRASSSHTVLTALKEQIARLDAGARLPTVRDLMRAHKVSQATVQEALARLRDEGLLTSQVGRGTYVIKGGAGVSGSFSDPRLDSLLILSNASLNERCVLVQNHIVDELSRSGSKIVQMSYHNTGHLLDILTSAPDFDAVILQSHYENIPIRLLRLLQEKTRALVVDGHTVSGVDVDRVGTDWEEALDLALDHLASLGHTSVALASLDTMAQPILTVRRAFERMQRRPRAPWRRLYPLTLQGVLHPTQRVGDSLRGALEVVVRPDGTLPFTAVITLGISDSFGVRACLESMGLDVPRDVSLFVLGHLDVPSEHLGSVSMAGSSYREGAEQLIDVIRRRIGERSAPPRIVYLGCAEAIRDSAAAPSVG